MMTLLLILIILGIFKELKYENKEANKKAKEILSSTGSDINTQNTIKKSNKT